MNERFVQTPHEPDQIPLNGLVAGKSVVKADHGREEPVVRYERVPEALRRQSLGRTSDEVMNEATTLEPADSRARGCERLSAPREIRPRA